MCVCVITRYPEKTRKKFIHSIYLTRFISQPGNIEGVKSKGKALMKISKCTFTYPINRKDYDPPGNGIPTLFDVRKIRMSLTLTPFIQSNPLRSLPAPRRSPSKYPCPPVLPALERTEPESPP